MINRAALGFQGMSMSSGNKKIQPVAVARFSGGVDEFLKDNADVLKKHQRAEKKGITEQRAAYVARQREALATEVAPGLTGQDLYDFIGEESSKMNYWGENDMAEKFGPFATQVREVLKKLVTTGALAIGTESDLMDHKYFNVYQTEPLGWKRWR